MIKTYDNFLSAEKCSLIRDQIENNLFNLKNPQILNMRKEISKFLNIPLDLQQDPFVIVNTEKNNSIENFFESKEELKSKTAILYLNDDYEGGSIYFKHHLLYIEPKIGKLLVFDRLSEEFWKFKGQEKFYRLGWNPNMNYSILPIRKGKNFLLVIHFLNKST